MTLCTVILRTATSTVRIVAGASGSHHSSSTATAIICHRTIGSRYSFFVACQRLNFSSLAEKKLSDYEFVKIIESEITCAEEYDDHDRGRSCGGGSGGDQPPAAAGVTQQSLYSQKIISLQQKSTTLSQLKQIQTSLFINGHSQNPLLSFKLLRFSSLIIDDLHYCRLIFNSLDSPNVYIYTAMLTAYSIHSHSSAVQLFVQMLHRGDPKPNEFIYPIVLKSCSNKSDACFVKLLHTHVVKCGFDGYHVIKTSLLDGYARFSDFGNARNMFDEMCDRNVVSWTALVSGYTRSGKIRDVISLFDEMPERDVPSWNTMIAGCTQNGQFPDVVNLFRKMVLSGALPNSTTVSCVLSACGHLGMLRLGKWIHVYVLKSQIAGNLFVSNALVDMYGKCGSLREARWVFDRLYEKSLLAWNSMINCLALHEHGGSVITTFQEIKRVGLVPDEVTFVENAKGRESEEVTRVQLDRG